MSLRSRSGFAPPSGLGNDGVLREEKMNPCAKTAAFGNRQERGHDRRHDHAGDRKPHSRGSMGVGAAWQSTTKCHFPCPLESCEGAFNLWRPRGAMSVLVPLSQGERPMPWRTGAGFTSNAMAEAPEVSRGTSPAVECPIRSGNVRLRGLCTQWRAVTWTGAWWPMPNIFFRILRPFSGRAANNLTKDATTCRLTPTYVDICF